MRLLLLAICLLLATNAIAFELPTFVYPDPKMAPEDLDVKILSVTKRITEDNKLLTRWEVELGAEVRAVRKSISKLSVGSKIVIRYNAHHYKQFGWTGPSSPPILRQGDIRSAVLSPRGAEMDHAYVPGGGPATTFGLPGRR